MRHSEQSSHSPDDASEERSTLIHRELLDLALLIAVVVVAFFVTRAIAANNRDMNLRDATQSYVRGQRQFNEGHPDDAIDSFRRATVKNRGEKSYVLALARALASTRQDEAARSALLMLRETDPEDRDINLQLARLAADRQDVTEAIGYYHNTLYAPWPLDQTEARQRVRIELIRFLLAHGQSNRAVSELVALSTDLPDDAPVHVEVGQLFLSAGESARALEHFQRALRLTPDTAMALAGAGQAAFQVGDYPLARTYLRTAPDTIAGVKETRELVDLVLSNDPLVARLGSSARRSRLVDALSYAKERLNACETSRLESAQAPDEERALRDAVGAFEKQMQSSRALEEDTIESGLELISRIEVLVTQTCPPLTTMDRALTLIAKHRGADQR